VLKKIKVEGMSCAHCSGRVEKILKSIPGVTKAVVNLKVATVEISLDREVNLSVLMAAVSEAGYKVSPLV
jgi:Cu+-exporting ATPase